MKKELCIKQIYEDFINKVFLSDIEKEVLIMYIRDESLVKIADSTNQSISSVSRIIADIKSKYFDYKKLELSKLNILSK